VASRITANAVNPGIVPGTGLLRDQSDTVRAAAFLLGTHQPH
jgi:hypothetical protein